ncbi:MAG: phosphotransferase family protein [Mesorhizobium sp.]
MTTTEDRIRALPCWSGTVEIEPLSGGLSNANYLVRHAGGRHVVRFGRDYPFHHVERAREAMTARAAHAAGFAPAVHYGAPGVLVTEFLGAITYGPADIRENRIRIAQFIRQFHDRMARHVSGPGFMFWVFHVIRDYARTLKAGNSRMAGRLPAFLTLAEEMESTQTPLPIIFGHNDLLPANFLDDGARLWLIDFEYAGFSTAMFDLAGISSNAEFSSDQAVELLETYFGAAPEPNLVRAHAAMSVASLLRETMWSLVSELHLDAPGVDYAAYTADNLARLDAALDNYRTRFGTAS